MTIEDGAATKSKSASSQNEPMTVSEKEQSPHESPKTLAQEGSEMSVRKTGGSDATFAKLDQRLQFEGSQPKSQK